MNLRDNVLDYIILASSNLEEAMKSFENMTGIKPKVFGSHGGLGIRSARVALDNNAWIEIIGPDPKNTVSLGSELASEIDEGALVPYHFGVRSSSISEMREEYENNDLGLTPDQIFMFGANPHDGTQTKWEVLCMYGHDLGGCMPFYVDWKEVNHPSVGPPEVGELKSLTVQAPSGHVVHDLLKQVDGITVKTGSPMLEFSFASPKGTVKFSVNNPKGMKFPGFEEGYTGAGGKNFPGMRLRLCDLDIRFHGKIF